MWSPKAAAAAVARDSQETNQARPTTPTTPATTKSKNPGRRIAQIVKLKPEYLDVYKEVHAKVWPEVLMQIKQCNIEDCR